VAATATSARASAIAAHNRDGLFMSLERIDDGRVIEPHTRAVSVDREIRRD
jgi:hypothetical protein